jgi:1,4-alpha-glucan branching enzyme
MNKGALSIVLHAHLPYVRHPEYPEFLEEDWLYEAITETYLPLLEVFDRCVDDGVPFRVTMTLTPPLVGMLRDELLVSRYARRLDQLCELSDKEVHRTRTDATFGPLAWHYRERHYHLRRLFHDRYKRDLVMAFKRLQDHGVLEIITCGATHGFLPLMVHQESIRAQIRVAAAHYRMHFGRDPRGIWLPECGYAPGIDKYLSAENIRFFFVDSHALANAVPRPRRGVYAPIYTPSGVAAFARDPESSMQVWSAEYGYPGDSDYREFYRDIGYDLDWDYVRPYIQATGARKNIGIKYYRITGKVSLDRKEPYNPEAARRKADAHAGNFLFNRTKQIEYLRGAFGEGPPPIVISPYDAELYGHWWYEGPMFIDFLIRIAAYDQETLQLLSPVDYLSMYPEQQLCQPPLSSWGAGGYAGVWLDESNDWIYRYLHKASERMIELARTHHDAASDVERRALNQAARELLLAQSSDWAFIMKTGTMVDYAVRRTREHLLRFTKLYDQLKGKQLDERWLGLVESKDNLFPEIDYRVYRPQA